GGIKAPRAWRQRDNAEARTSEPGGCLGVGMVLSCLALVSREVVLLVVVTTGKLVVGAASAALCGGRDDEYSVDGPCWTSGWFCHRCESNDCRSFESWRFAAVNHHDGSPSARNRARIADRPGVPGS